MPLGGSAARSVGRDVYMYWHSNRGMSHMHHSALSLKEIEQVIVLPRNLKVLTKQEFDLRTSKLSEIESLPDGLPPLDREAFTEAYRDVAREFRMRDMRVEGLPEGKYVVLHVRGGDKPGPLSEFETINVLSQFSPNLPVVAMTDDTKLLRDILANSTLASLRVVHLPKIDQSVIEGNTDALFRDLRALLGAAGIGRTRLPSGCSKSDPRQTGPAWWTRRGKWPCRIGARRRFQRGCIHYNIGSLPARRGSGGLRPLADENCSTYSLLQSVDGGLDRHRELQRSLYNHWSASGLFDWPCRPDHARGGHEVFSRAVSSMKHMRKFVLRAVGRRASTGQGPEKGRREIVIPVNSADDNAAGMGSYPNFPAGPGAGRWCQYPDMDAWFEACNIAAVDCSLLVLVRHPDEVIHSTTIRRGFQEKHAQIRTSADMLSIIHTQVQNNLEQPHWCWKYGDNDISGVANAFGLEKQSVSSFFKHNFRLSRWRDKKKGELTQHLHQAELTPLHKAFERVKELC